MSLNAAAGYPQYSGVLIPTVWSGKLLVEFYESTCLSQVTNTEYEGEIKKMGDKVTIRTLPSIEVHDYTKGQDLDYQSPDPDTVELNINKGKYWAFVTDTVDKYQSDIDYVSKWTAHAGEKVARKVEQGVFADVYADANAYNLGNTAGKISLNIRLGATGAAANHVALTNGATGTGAKKNVLEFASDCQQVCDENDMPVEGRFMILPAFATNLIRTSDLKDASVSGDGKSTLRNGRHGNLCGFDIYQSNLLTTASDSSTTITYALFGHISAITWAAQFTENDVLKSERTFGWKYRGLNIYGYETIKAQALGRAIIRKAVATDS